MLGIAIAVALLLEVIWIAREVLTWILIAVFFALALNPAVDWFQRHGIKRRGLAAAVTFLIVIGAIAALGALFIPTLVDEVNGFVNALPGYVDDVTHRRGRLGFLESKYHVTERVRSAVKNGGASSVLGLTGTALAITKGIITAIVATVTIIVHDLLHASGGPRVGGALLHPAPRALAGPLARDRPADLPNRRRLRDRQPSHQRHRGVTSTIVLLALGVPYAVALGLLVAILDLVPLAGATIAAIVVCTVGFIHSVPAGIVLLVFFILYQQLENHVLQPFVYSRTVKLSPLVILIAVLIGAQLAGVLGALAAIPVAGTLQVLLVSWLAERRKRHAHPATV